MHVRLIFGFSLFLAVAAGVVWGDWLEVRRSATIKSTTANPALVRQVYAMDGERIVPRRPAELPA